MCRGDGVRLHGSGNARPSQAEAPSLYIKVESIEIKAVEKNVGGTYVVFLSRQPSSEWQNRFKKGMGSDRLYLWFGFEPQAKLHVWGQVDDAFFLKIRKILDETNGSEKLSSRYFPPHRKTAIERNLGLRA